MTMLMMLAFLVDQFSSTAATFIKKRGNTLELYVVYFEKVRNRIDIGVWDNWHHLYTFIGDRHQGHRL